MASLFAKDCCDTALSEVGYQADGKWNKYADVLDSVDYFVGCGKKQGLDWCCVFVCYCLYMNTLNADSVKEPNAWAARWFQFQSDTCNTAAVVKYMAQFYKDNGAWGGEQEAGKGSVIFYQKSNGVLYHVGLVVDWGYFDELGTDGFKVVEGNTNGGQVAIKYYKFGDPKIAGFGLPRYDGWELETSKPEPEKPSEPTPPDEPRKSVDELAREVIAGKWGNGRERANRLTEAGYDYQEVQDRVNEILGVNTAGDTAKYYTVCVNTKLNVRAGAGTSYPIVYQLRNGDKVEVYETDGDWGRIGDGEWVCTKYLV